MRSGVLYIAIVAALVPGTSSWAAPKVQSSARQKLIQSCDAHKFETVVDVTVDGQPRQSRVKLCGVEGQSDAAWINTLRDAIKKLEAKKDMPAAQRQQIVTAIKSEIARLSILGPAPVPPRPGRSVAAAPVEPLSRDYATLPPLPLPGEQPSPVVQLGSVQAAPVERRAQTNGGEVRTGAVSMPPPAMPRLASGAAAPQPMITRPVAPRLRFGCDTPGDLSSDAPCAEFERDTTITVHAAEDVPAGTLLQFVRNDQPQAVVALDGLRRGGAIRLALPPKVCAGFTSGKLDLRIVRDSGSSAALPLSSDGPYSLRC